jgi:anaerobic selenocysteine-containing dehydrogenase
MTAWTADPANGVPAKDQYIFGLMCWGQNPAVGGPSCYFERQAMTNLEWLMVAELWETETAAFWKFNPDGTPRTPAEMAAVGTEVFLLPAACSYEKEGSIVNSGRWSQWRYAAIAPPKAVSGHPETYGPYGGFVEGEGALDDLEIINRLAKDLISKYQADGSSLLADPVANLHWGFYPGTDAHTQNGSSPNGYDDLLGHADPHRVAWEINGYFCPSSTTGTQGRRVDGFWGANASVTTLQENGQTSSGNWLYCSHYVNPGDPNDQSGYGNRQENRGTTDNSASGIGLYSSWSYCWPLNRRIIYNGASVYQVDPSQPVSGQSNLGKPLAPNKWVIAFDPDGLGNPGKVARTGGDVSDGFTAPGDTQPRYPFIMQREGHGKLFGPGREDGPFPEHYEPWETVLATHSLEAAAGETPHVLTSPTLFEHIRPGVYEHPSFNSNPGQFKIVGTTYRVTEHWQAGQLTRNNPWLCQLQPDVFVELDEELANTLSIQNGDTVEIKTQRTEYYGRRMRAVACVTKRFKPYTIDGSKVYHIGAIWHFGYTGCCTGDSANLLTPHIGDANTGIPESKSFICNIRKYNPLNDLGWL